jgi:serralysin
MTGNITLLLSSGGTISVNGAVIAALATGASEIENAFMGDGSDTVKGNGLANEAHGMRGDDLLRGANGNDVLNGGKGNDTMHGDNGNDTLKGGDGNDLMYGTAGNDQLYGEGGSDTFVFAKPFGADRVRDFTDNVDQLKLDDAIWGSTKTAAQIVADYATVVGSDTVFDFGDGNKITVNGVTDTSVFLNDIVIF